MYLSVFVRFSDIHSLWLLVFPIFFFLVTTARWCIRVPYTFGCSFFVRVCFFFFFFVYASWHCAYVKSIRLHAHSGKHIDKILWMLVSRRMHRILQWLAQLHWIRFENGNDTYRLWVWLNGCVRLSMNWIACPKYHIVKNFVSCLFHMQRCFGWVHLKCVKYSYGLENEWMQMLRTCSYHIIISWMPMESF